MLRRIFTIIGYLALAVLLVGSTIVLVAYGNDYAYDFSTHKVIQKGHIIINSLPTGVRVTADGHALTKKTPYQAAYTVGAHTISLALPGYWPWQKTLSVVAGQVTLAQYVIMVPKSPVTTVLDTKPQIVAQAISKDHRHLAYITGGPNAALYTSDLGGSKPVKLYTPKAAAATTPAEVLTGVNWSDDASHLLVSATDGGQPAELLVPAGGGAPVNLTQQYGFSFSGIAFSASDWSQLYWIAPDGLRHLNVGAQTVSNVLAPNVTQFWVTSSRILYVQQAATGPASLWSIDGGGHHQELIEALVPSSSYSVAYASFSGADELAVVPESTQTGTLYTGIFGYNSTAKIVAHGVTDASFSPDSHLLAFTSPTLIVTYDLNQSQLENKFIAYTISNQPGQLQALSWFDNYHMLLTRSGELYWSEYDGANQVDLGPVSAGFPAYSTPNRKSLIKFLPHLQTVQITQVNIVK